MSLKTLLGLEAFPFREEEIIARINQAYKDEVKEIVFSAGKKKVKIKLNQLSPDGLMRGYQDYFSAK